jgi:hypothetical protein
VSLIPLRIRAMRRERFAGLFERSPASCICAHTRNSATARSEPLRRYPNLPRARRARQADSTPSHGLAGPRSLNFEFPLPSGAKDTKA